MKTVLPPLLLIGPSVSLSEAGVPFCTVQTLHFAAAPFPPLTRRHSETQIFMQFRSIRRSLAKNPILNKRLHLWGGEGQTDGEICPHVLNLRESLAFTH